MGPHHPSTHGVFRMDVVLDGERVVKLKPVFGYLHRNHEKIAEDTTYLGSMPYTDRLDYFCSMTNNWAYALAVEKLAGLQVPERAEYIRVITRRTDAPAKSRLPHRFSRAGHGRARHAADVCVPRARKNSRPVRVAQRRADDVQLHALRRLPRAICRPAGSSRRKRSWMNFPRFLDEFETLLDRKTKSSWRARRASACCRGNSPSTPASPARCCAPAGVNYDIRKVDKYGIYDRFQFPRAARRARRLFTTVT